MSSGFQQAVDAIESGTHAVIDLDAYAANIGLMRSFVPSDVGLMAVVKADAYGHGAAECGVAALEAGAAMLGVARIQEGLYLRRYGVTGEIVVIGPPTLGELHLALEHNITLSIGSQASLEALLALVGDGRTGRVHVKLDTGMNRYGFSPSEVCEAIESLVSSPYVVVDGLYTHYSSADELVRTPTERQNERFWGAVAQLDSRGLRPRYLHTCNSAGIMTGEWEGTTLVRSGVSTYGMSPSPEVGVDDRFQPIMQWRSVISRRSTLLAGEAVSYGETYRATADEQIAAVPVGYADGLPRRLRNQGWFVVGGQRAPIEGSVCMDQTVVGVPVDAAEGDPVLIIGDGSVGDMTFDDAAAIVGTVNYEVSSRLTPRVPRLYRRNGQPVAWERILTGERGRIDE